MNAKTTTATNLNTSSLNPPTVPPSGRKLATSNDYYDDSLTLQQATDYLRELLGEFPFSDWRDEIVADEAGGTGERVRQSRSMAVQVAAMLSQFADGCVPANAMRMGFLWNANVPRSGKTLLAKLAIVPTNGTVAVQSWNSKDEELRKVLDAEVLRGSTYVLFDNVRGHVASQVLEGFMTSPNWTGRVLGLTKMFTAPNLATVFITGNDCTVGADITQRLLICNLFVTEANVRDRSISKMIDDPWLMDWMNRRRILSCLWAIVRYWDFAGRPGLSVMPRTGFEAWGQRIGGMVEFAGFGNCLAEPQLDNAGDTETQDMNALIESLVEGMRARRAEFTFQQIVNRCFEQGLFEWVLDGKEDGADFVLKPHAASRLGKIVRKYAPIEGQRVFRLPKGKAGVHVSGKNRHRRYIIDLDWRPEPDEVDIPPEAQP